MDLQDIRKDYSWGALEEDKVNRNPFKQFTTWYEQYTTFDVPDSTAMIVSTVGKDGVPRTRVVLLKEMNDEAFIFYTNYHSQKVKAIESGPVDPLGEDLVIDARGSWITPGLIDIHVHGAP